MAATAMIGPKFYAWDDNGVPLAFGKLYTYQARTNVPKPTYTSEDQTVENTNPVILNGSGYADVYLDGSYKIVLKDVNDNEIWTADPVTPGAASEWQNTMSATYVSPTKFSVFGNFVDIFEEYRRVRLDSNAAEYAFGTITDTTYGGGVTTVTIFEPIVTTGIERAAVSIVGSESLSVSTMVKKVDTIADLQGLTGTIGQQVSVASYHGLNDLSGGGTFVWGTGRHNGGTFIDPNRPFPADWNDQAQLVAWFADSGSDISGWKRQHTSISFDDFGADSKGIIFPTSSALLVNPSLTYIINNNSDSTLPIQAAINYAAPYEWAGSVALTKNSLRTNCSIIGNGNYRVTGTIKINPFVKIEASSRGGFSSNGSGLGIFGDFTDPSKYLLDTAPMFAGGARPLGRSYGRNDWEGSSTEDNSVGCMGWFLLGLNIQMIRGQSKGALNRQIAMESVVKYCRIGNGLSYEGVRTEVTWGGELSQNNIVGSAYAIRNGNDVTTDDQTNNYCSISGTKPNALEYDYVVWPEPSLQGFTACIMSVVADAHIRANTCEKGQIGLAAITGLLYDDGGYYEGITDYIYASHTSSLSLRPEWIFCAEADLIYAKGSSGSNHIVDMTACNEANLAGLGLVGSFVSRGVVLQGSTRVINLTHNSRFEYSDIAVNGDVNIYVSSEGSDASSGYSSSYPVLTIQEAFTRCQKGKNNIINFGENETITTKYNYSDVNVTSKLFDGLKAVVKMNSGVLSVGASSNQTHCIALTNSAITFQDGLIDLSLSASVDNYRSFLRVRKGSTCFQLNNVSVVGSGKVLFGSQYGDNGHANINMDSVILGSGVEFTNKSTTNKSFSWIETSTQVTNNGAVVGSASDGLIYSTTF